MKAQLRLLRRLGAPEELISSFKEVCEINDRLPDSMKSGFDKLLEEQCRKFGFHEILPDGWFFRPYGSHGQNHRKDSRVSGDEAEAPAIEQAFRRGFVQGFTEYQDLAKTASPKDLARRASELHKWRTRPVQKFGSTPGDTEKPPRKLFGGRSGLSLAIRWMVLERDRRRCVVCGRSASESVILEVDHIVPVANGGRDEPGNLQTLCMECNRGKGVRPPLNAS